MFKIARERYPKLDPEVIIRYTIMDLNDTMGPEGLVPSMMVIGTIQTFQTSEINNHGKDERMDVIRTARPEMERITIEFRINTALKEKLPQATRFDFCPGQTVRVYWEKSRRCEGPFKETNIHGRKYG